MLCALNCKSCYAPDADRAQVARLRFALRGRLKSATRAGRVPAVCLNDRDGLLAGSFVRKRVSRGRLAKDGDHGIRLSFQGNDRLVARGAMFHVVRDLLRGVLGQR